MGAKTEITWTDSTWNPVTGCTPVSAGCDNCYAARYAKRRMGDFGTRYMLLTGEELGARKFSEIRPHPNRLDIPLRWRKPRRIFVCSMGDLFHESVPTDFQELVFRTMISASQHVFQVLTKRAFAMQAAIPVIMHRICGPHWVMPKNIWLGVTAENQATADERIPLLLKTPAAVRFVSVEPMLGPIMIDTFLGDLPEDNEGAPYPGKLDWVICGGESGPNARPCYIKWIESIVSQCKSSGTPCHVKQLGAYPVWAGTETRPIAPARGKCNYPEEWPEGLRVREIPA